MQCRLTNKKKYRTLIFCFFLFIIMILRPVEALMDILNCFTLPESIISIEEESFAGCTNIRTFILPESLETIGKLAFANTEIYTISIPGNVTYIAYDAFEGITTPVLIQTVPESEAVHFAMNHKLDFDAGTVYRALLIGQSSYPSYHALTGPIKDIENMEGLLSDNYNVTVKRNLSTDQILSAVSSTFGSAREEDVSLFYYSGHGLESSNPEMNGALTGIDYASYITASELRTAMDSIQGRKIVIIDACYSGSLIKNSAEKGAETDKNTQKTKSVTEAPAVSFLQNFLAGKRGRSLAAETYYVMVSSAGTEGSWENRSGGIFTNAFAESRTKGDLNKDGIVTFLESYTYTKDKVHETVTDNDLEQTVQVYPENCFWFGLFR